MSVKDDLIAAKAMIDTPEKWKDRCGGIVSAILASRRGISIGDFNAARVALISQFDERATVTEWAYGRPHADIMALFDRAINAAGDA